MRSKAVCAVADVRIDMSVDRTGVNYLGIDPRECLKTCVMTDGHSTNLDALQCLCVNCHLSRTSRVGSGEECNGI
jgi:hypothetical protein